MAQFPQNFLWGAATSSYQVEGNNRHADWWHWEKRAGKERSGAACRHYERYEHDFDLAKSLHHNAHRLSVEWSRVEPRQGKFSRRELRHYRDVILALRQRGIEPIVTLHHFTNPLWFSRAGGWEKRAAVKYFARFCEAVIRALAAHVHYWITINEPTIYISHSYLFGVWPPQEKSYVKAAAVAEHLAQAHITVYSQLHAFYRQRKLPAPAVSIAQNVMAFVPCGRALKNRFAAYVRHAVYNLGFLERICGLRALGCGCLDFIGVNYYSRQLVALKKIGIENLAKDVCERTHRGVKKNSLGWDIYPHGLYDVLLALKKYKLPVMITENGICTAHDRVRWQYIRDHLTAVHRAMRRGVTVIGYLYWSLLDNFEWDKGFGPRFGLIEVDYRTGKRTIRASARRYARVCQSGTLGAKKPS